MTFRLKLTAALSLCMGAAFAAPSNEFLGRWDLTIAQGGASRPSWMEVKENQGAVTVSFVGVYGSAEPARDVELKNGRLTFATEDFFGHEPAMHVECSIDGGGISGAVTRAEGKLPLSGKRAPRLSAPANPKWGPSIVLFNGKDLDGWRLDQPQAGNWAAENGLLISRERGSNIITTKEFQTSVSTSNSIAHPTATAASICADVMKCRLRMTKRNLRLQAGWAVFMASSRRRACCGVQASGAVSISLYWGALFG